MANDADISSTQAVAVIALLLALLVPVAVGLAWWLKQRYARAVVLMQASTAAVQTPLSSATSFVSSVEASQTPPPLSVQLFPAGSVTGTGADPTASPRRLRRRVLFVQFAAGLVYWLGMLLTVAVALAIYAVATDSTDKTEATSVVASALVILPLLLLPPLLGWALQAGTRESVAWWIVVAGAVALAAGLLMTGQGLIAVVAVPAVLAGLGLTLTAFLRPSVRGAGPPLMASMIAGFLVFSAFAAVAAALDDSSADDWGTWKENLAQLALLLAVLALSAWVGWRMLLRISRRYTEKRFSELQLALGAYWGLMTLFVLTAVMFLSFEDKTGGSMEWVGLLVVVMWLLWRVLQRLALRWAVQKAAPPLSPLLLLRVFKPSGRSEAFIDRFLARWRFAAPIWMIAGPDLAGALMEPDEFFAYLRRGLADRFINDVGQIGQRLGALDNERDPDGRFRVNELFCANTTWQQTFLAMIERAGAVLLDLREYTEKRAGTRFELQELLRRVPLERVLLLTDEAGDAPQLRAAIAEAWQAVGRKACQTVRIVQLREESDAELDGLFRAVAQAESSLSKPAPS
jgi:hypothetical protein